MYMAFVRRLFYTMRLRKVLRVMKNDNCGEYALYKQKINFVVIIYLFFYSNESLTSTFIAVTKSMSRTDISIDT